MPTGIYHHKPCTESTKNKISLANKGEKNGMWKGDKAKYRAIHAWIKKNYGKADRCEGKSCKGRCKTYQWANISGEYKRDIKDYIMLCRSCHIQFDNIHIKISKTLTGRKMPEETKRKISLANKGK